MMRFSGPGSRRYTGVPTADACRRPARPAMTAPASRPDRPGVLLDLGQPHASGLEGSAPLRSAEPYRQPLKEIHR